MTSLITLMSLNNHALCHTRGTRYIICHHHLEESHHICCSPSYSLYQSYPLNRTAYLRDDLRVIREVTCTSPDSSSLEVEDASSSSSCIASKFSRAWAVDISWGISSPSSVRHSGQGTPQLKHTGMSLNQGMVQGSLTEKAQFSLG